MYSPARALPPRLLPLVAARGGLISAQQQAAGAHREAQQATWSLAAPRTRGGPGRPARTRPLRITHRPRPRARRAAPAGRGARRDCTRPGRPPRTAPLSYALPAASSAGIARHPAAWRASARGARVTDASADHCLKVSPLRAGAGAHRERTIAARRGQHTSTHTGTLALAHTRSASSHRRRMLRGTLQRDCGRRAPVTRCKCITFACERALRSVVSVPSTSLPLSVVEQVRAAGSWGHVACRSGAPCGGAQRGGGGPRGRRRCC